MNANELAKLVQDLGTAARRRRLLLVLRSESGEVVAARNVGFSVRLSNPGHYVILEAIVPDEARKTRTEVSA